MYVYASTHTHTHTFYTRMSASVCVCVCVFARCRCSPVLTGMGIILSSDREYTAPNSTPPCRTHTQYIRVCVQNDDENKLGKLVRARASCRTGEREALPPSHPTRDEWCGARVGGWEYARMRANFAHVGFHKSLGPVPGAARPARKHQISCL